MIRRTQTVDRSFLATVALLGLLGGCSSEDVRQPPPDECWSRSMEVVPYTGPHVTTTRLGRYFGPARPTTWCYGDGIEFLAIDYYYDAFRILYYRQGDDIISASASLKSHIQFPESFPVSVIEGTGGWIAFEDASREHQSGHVHAEFGDYFVEGDFDTASPATCDLEGFIGGPPSCGNADIDDDPQAYVALHDCIVAAGSGGFSATWDESPVGGLVVPTRRALATGIWPDGNGTVQIALFEEDPHAVDHPLSPTGTRRICTSLTDTSRCANPGDTLCLTCEGSLPAQQTCGPPNL